MWPLELLIMLPITGGCHVLIRSVCNRKAIQQEFDQKEKKKETHRVAYHAIFPYKFPGPWKSRQLKGRVIL